MSSPKLTQASLSSSIARFRQGVSRRRMLDFYRSLIPNMTMGEPFFLQKSGSFTRDDNVFDDSAAVTGKRRLGNSNGYVVKINHQVDQDTFGYAQSLDPITDKPWFSDDTVYSTTTGSRGFKVQDLLSSVIRDNLPPSILYKSSPNQMNATIEPIPIRRVIDFTAVGWERDNRATGIFLSMNTGLENGNIRSNYTYNDLRIAPFDDKYEFTSKLILTGGILAPQIDPPIQIIMMLPNTSSFASSSIKPYTDMSLAGSDYGSVFTKDGFQVPMMTRGDMQMAQVLAGMTGTVNDFYGKKLFDRFEYGSAAGMVYTPAQQIGWNMGTDSIAFGGLKK